MDSVKMICVLLSTTHSGGMVSNYSCWFVSHLSKKKMSPEYYKYVMNKNK